MTTTTESGGRQNMFPTETRPYIDESISMNPMQRMQRRSMVDGQCLV